tara:strand:+ start:18 stop:317 length:300 start_codon:yes stop_codon:yes gene_type:complete
MTLQNRQYYYNIRNFNLQEAREKTLTVLFKTKEMMMERIYERDLKLKFSKLFSSVKQVKPDKSFEIIFKGEKNELKKVVKYITSKLDRKNGVYDSHTIK